MNESKLIATLASSREAFNKLVSHIEFSTFSDLGQSIYKEIIEFYGTDKNANKVDLDIVQEKLKLKYGKHYDLVHEYIVSLPEPSSLENLLSLFNALKKDKLGLELMQAISSKKEDKTVKLMEEYLVTRVEDEQEEVFNATPLEELESHFTGKNLIPIYPSKLNQYLGGGLPRQSQVCIFARPDVGKSTAAINIAGGAAKNGYKVLYIGNEDPAPKMVYRIVSRLLGKPEHEIRNNLKKYYEEALERGYKNIFFVPMHPGTLSEVRANVEKYIPDIVIVDQIRNFAINESMTVNLEQGCIGMRNLAKEFNFVSVVITQAGESAHNKLILDYTDVEWSNTGVAAQMDLMIGVGQNEEFKLKNKVMLAFPKNKVCDPIKPFHAGIDYLTNTIMA